MVSSLRLKCWSHEVQRTVLKSLKPLHVLNNSEVDFVTYKIYCTLKNQEYDKQK